MNAINIKQTLITAFWSVSFLLPCIYLPAQQPPEDAVSDTTLFQETFRPQFHLTPVTGWVNDPTALVYVDGLYQVNKRLAVSTDLIHWQREEHPHSFNTKDSVGEMSGSAVLDINNTSGFGVNGKPPLVSVWSGLRFRDMRQYQCVSYSNDEGRTWIKYDKNPVIDIGSTEFRDPQVFWYEKDKKWIMVVALAAERKARFYSSPNLRDWTFLSDFGPAGADNGVWECPDFFALPVDGNKQHMKWVLEVSVQPTGGQYFVGSFDGTTFTADPHFINKPVKNNTIEGTLLFDFEKDLAGWTTEGTAFAASPYAGYMPMQGAILGYEGKKLVNSFYHGDSTVGKITSPSFSITKNYLNFLIGGGEHPGTTAINLLVDNKVVRTATGPNTEVLKWAHWDVAKFKGQQAKIEIVDNEKGGFGHITVDQIMLSDQPKKNEEPKAFWIDYGPDYYAVRSWVNGPAGDDRRISSAWMSNWLYAQEIPTKPWKGIHTFPREMELKTFPEGIRMIQKPIAEISMLRDKRYHLDKAAITTTASPINFTHDKNSYELIAEIDPQNSEEVGFNLCAGPKEKTIVSYNVASQTISIDRTASGLTSFSKSFPGVYTAPLQLNSNKKIKLHILVDQCSIEVFGNDGEATLTCQVFPDTKSLGIEAFSKGGNAMITGLDAWTLLPFWEKKTDVKANAGLIR
jgi:sucrose-6-phosphate hydrolase SacC (GH32 family)